MKPNINIDYLTGWFSSQIEATLELYGDNLDTKGYLHAFMSGLKPEIAKQLATSGILSKKIRKIALEVWKE